MREIKFRAWDKERKRWTNYSLADDLQRFYEKSTGCWKSDKNNERFALMQYTGLKDISGKEIYEGDIIKAVYFARWIGTVEFCEENAAYILKDIEKMPYRDDYVFLSQFDDGFEVLGNICENPELLQKLNI